MGGSTSSYPGKLIGQENVEDFPSDKFLEWLGDLYDIQVVLLDPADFGWGIRRRRKYHIMRHKFKAGPMSCPLNMFAKMFIDAEEKALKAWKQKQSQTQAPVWDMYFVAPPDDLTEELEWASGRGSVEKPVLNWKDMTPGGCYELCLNNFESEQLRHYREAWPMQCYQLNQSFNQQATHSSDAYLNTIIKNAGIIWILDCISKWFLAYFVFYFIFYLGESTISDNNLVDFGLQ